MRLAAASLVDVVLFALAALIGFHLALWSAPCPNQSNCAILTPLILVCVTAAVGAYAGVCHLLWRTTLGRRAFPQTDRDP